MAETVIGAAYEVSNDLGAGFLEKVYERALTRELALRACTRHSRCIILLAELRCVDRFIGEHTAQCINYLRASGLRLGLLFNFQQPKVEWKGIIF